jgi:pimeloyl-ACP methyl ester carboxylesterase
MSPLGTNKAALPTSAVPYSQRLLRALPTPFLKVANSSFMSATSSSLTTSLPKSPKRTKRKSLAKDAPTLSMPDTLQGGSQTNGAGHDRVALTEGGQTGIAGQPMDSHAVVLAAQAKARQSEYDTRLTYRIWELATTNANPAVDLLVCLERRQTIGFRYTDINREVVIHHGTRDTRVPVDNVRWLGQTMRRCEVRVLEGEGHGLMASAIVMSNVLTEMAKEWEDWTLLVQGKRGRRATMNHSSRPGIRV